MNCKQADQYIIDYLYDGLDGADKLAFEEHISSCPAHEKDVERMKSVLTLMRKQPKYKLSRDSERIILAQAEVHARRNPRLSRIVWNPAAAVALVAVLMLTVGIVVVRDFRPEKEELVFEPGKPLAVSATDEEARHMKPDTTPGLEKSSEPAETQRMEPRKKISRTRARKKRELPPREKKWTAKSKDADKLEQDRKSLFASAPPEKIAEREAPEVQITDVTGYSTQSGRPARAPAARQKRPETVEKSASGLSESKVAAEKTLYDPQATTGKFHMAKALFLKNDCEKAVTAIREVVAAAPDHPLAGQALLDQASCLVRLNRFEEAGSVYEHLIKDYPEHRQEAERGLRRIGR